MAEKWFVPRNSKRPAFDITCSSCKRPASVPFEPDVGRDVYCQPCWRARRSTLRPEADPIADEGADSGIVE